MLNALFPALVVAGVAVIAAVRIRNRRRWARTRLTGGRKALVLYLADRDR